MPSGAARLAVSARAVLCAVLRDCRSVTEGQAARHTCHHHISLVISGLCVSVCSPKRVSELNICVL